MRLILLFLMSLCGFAITASESTSESTSESECISGAPLTWHNYSSRSRAAYELGISYLKCLQTPHKNSGVYRINAPITGGGFGSLFQIAAGQLFFHIQNETQFPVQLVGNFRIYTSPKVCRESLSIGLMNCYFEDLVMNETSDCETECEAKCAKYDPGIVYRGENWNSPWWWGVLHSYMFRPNTFLKSALLNKTGLNIDTTFDFGVHIRIGGKKERNEEFKRRGIKFEVESYLNATMSIIDRCKVEGRKYSVYIASDSPESRPYIMNWLQTNDNIVIGHMQQPGLTQRYAQGGREAFLNTGTSTDSNRLDLSLEILTDLWYLSRSNIFVGITMSQLARLLVALGMSQGTMSQAIAMDPHKIGYTRCELIYKFGHHEGFMALNETTDAICARGAPGRHLSNK